MFSLYAVLSFMQIKIHHLIPWKLFSITFSPVFVFLDFSLFTAKSRETQ